MLAYILRRIMIMIPTLLGVTIIVFLMLHATPGDPAELIAGSDRIRHELGWQPQYPGIREIIESAWQWHVKNPNGYS